MLKARLATAERRLMQVPAGICISRAKVITGPCHAAKDP